ncbi:hypothetical protein [Rhizobium sp. BK176]|uniref:hypothetical protein n=1 Tax=Rhizobium sp. BK176 TaxID=2587071 RepID=UPI00216A22C5|nr:hypothetical protein [Rhizobium sp. BK176]MCS4089621.1 hypothetical protein [Rhizobium sp. BK176]
MKIIVPVIFHAPVTVSSGPRSILTFVEVAIPFRRLSEEDAPLAISRTVNHDVVRNFRVYDGTLYAATTRLSEFRSESDQILESVSSIERNLAREAAAELQKVGLAKVFPRDAIDMLQRASRINGYPERVQDRRVAYRKAATEKSENTRMRNLVSASSDFDAMCSAWIDKAQEFASDHILVGGTVFDSSTGLIIRVERDDDHVEVGEWDLHRHEWTAPLGKLDFPIIRPRTHYFAAEAWVEAMEFAQDIAEKAGVSVEMRNPAEYLLPHDRLPGVDMRYPELVRAAKNVAFAVGTEITRRLKNQELAVFDDDSTIRYAFDRLHDVIRTVDPFGAPDSRVETALVELLEALRDDPAKTKAVYRNMLDHHSEILDHADTVLRLWDERPMDIDITKAQAPGMRQ